MEQISKMKNPQTGQPLTPEEIEKAKANMLA